MNNGVLAIGAAECKGAAERETTLEGRLTAAFRVAKDLWMTTDENEQFQSAVAAVHMLSSDEDKQRIESEMLQLRTLSALLSGVPVDLDAIKKSENPIGLMKLWKAIKHGRED